MRRTFYRGLFGMCGLLVVLFAGEFLVEWWRLGMPPAEDLGWADVNNTKLVDVLSPMARAYNNVLAMLLATIGLAIPLTANMHTPKLIDMFLRDRLNQVVLFVMALGAANVIYVDYLIGPKFAPMWAFRAAVYGALAGWALLIPYFFYVVRFLDPSTILARLKDDTTRVVERTAAAPASLPDARAVVHERLYQIGTFILKALDRADRGVALEGIWSLKRIADHYGEHKARMPEAWFTVDRKDFVGASAEAIAILKEERIWFEMKVLSQMSLAYQHALAKTSDVISSISDANRVIAGKAAARNDGWALELAVKLFNNFLREAIKKKDLHAIYDVFYQYRSLALEIPGQPVLLREIARYFRYYSDFANASGLPFVAQIAALDLGHVVRCAYEAGSPAAGELLAEVLAMDHTARGEPLGLVVKAKIVLGSFFVEKGMAAEAGQVRASLAGVASPVLRSCERDLLSAERSFWEITDRQENFEYVPPARRPFVQAFVASF